MNVVFLMNDSLRRDHVNAYGVPPPWKRIGREGEPFIHTPNLDRLAGESAVFDRCYCASYPTIPNRYDLLAGRYGFPTRGWQPLLHEDVILPEIVRAHGYLPMTIFDMPGLNTNDYNFNRGFAIWRAIRGQLGDGFTIDTVDRPLPAAARKLRVIPTTKQFLRNRSRWQYERDYMCGQTLSAAMDLLEDNWTRDGFVLWIDMWNPHEPFDPPEYDLQRYCEPGYSGDRIIYPQYGRADYLSEKDLNHIRALYAGQVTLVDRWVGRFLEKLETLGLDKNTLVIHTTDHGHLFGDHGLQGKPTGVLGMLYEVTTRIPLMIRHPGGIGAGRRIDAIVQPPDILPTILEFLGVPIPPSVEGKSLWPLIEGRVDRIRDVAFSGRYSRSFGRPDQVARMEADAAQFDGWAGVVRNAEPLTVTTEEWAFICPPADRPRELYHLPDDPGQTRNLIAERPEVAAELHRRLIAFLEEHGADPQRIARYRGDDGRVQES